MSGRGYIAKTALLHRLSGDMAVMTAYWGDAFGRYAHTGSFSRVSEAPPEELVAALRGRIERTWNEMDSRIHPAVKREGRCLSHVEFAEFSPEEARRWLECRGVEPAAADGQRTLADLYAAVRRRALEAALRGVSE